jgi:hypothetical protein
MPTNGRPILGRIGWCGMCLPIRCLAMGLYITILIVSYYHKDSLRGALRKYTFFRVVVSGFSFRERRFFALQLQVIWCHVVIWEDYEPWIGEDNGKYIQPSTQLYF